MSSELNPGRTTALAATLQAVGGGLGWSLLPPLLPQIAGDLGIGHAAAGVVWGAAPLGIALASPLGGAAVDRWGPRRVAGLAMFAGALACAARAVAVGPWSLAVAMLLFGVHVGFVAPAIPKALVGDVPLNRLGRASGMTLLAYTLGTALTVLTARTLIAPLFGGWRGTMVAAAVAMVAAGAAWMVGIRDRQLPNRHAGIGAVLGLARDRDLVKLGAMQFLLFGGYLALLGLLPRALTESGLAPAQVGVAVAAWLVAAGVSNLVGPWISDRIGRRKPVLLVGSLVAGIGLVIVSTLPPEAAGPALVLAALGGGAVAPLLLAIPLELPSIGPARAGAALGLLMLVGQAGGFLLPVATGAAAQGGGFAVALSLLAIAHLLLVVPALRLAETGTASRAPAGPLPAPTPVLARAAPAPVEPTVRTCRDTEDVVLETGAPGRAGVAARTVAEDRAA